MPKPLKLSLFINPLLPLLPFVVSLLYFYFYLFPQLWQCPQLPFLLRSIFFHPVKYGCARDDCNAVETTAMVLFPNKTKGRVACHPGLTGGLKSHYAFRIGLRVVWPGQQILKDVEKRNMSVLSQHGYTTTTERRR